MNTIYTTIKELLIDKFGIDGDIISPEKQLEAELDFDSLDAVDLLIYLSDYVNGKPEPALFKNAKTVQDLADALRPIWKSE